MNHQGQTNKADFGWNYSNYGSCGLVPDSSKTNDIDQSQPSQPSLEASITEEFYQTYPGSYHSVGWVPLVMVISISGRLRLELF